VQRAGGVPSVYLGHTEVYANRKKRKVLAKNKINKIQDGTDNLYCPQLGKALAMSIKKNGGTGESES